MSVGLYIHIPFCRTRCHFCAFYLEIHRKERAAAYVESLSREIKLYAAQGTLEGRPPDSVYFGGGTPTALEPVQLNEILHVVQDHLGPRDYAEITLEAHPDTVTKEGLKSLRQAGFNRISFGVQSMDENELARIGRRTLPESARTAVALARAAGFDSVNLDLIYGLPGQTLASWRSTLQEAIALDIPHLSCYALTIEEGTRLQRDLHRGKWSETDSSLQLTMEHETQRQLSLAGLQRYEISNFCRPGYACRHNLLYWTGQEYLGLGPSAQSYVNGCRFGNIDDLEAYQKTIRSGRLPIAQFERLSPDQRRREAIVFGLRLTDGIDLAALGIGMQSSDQSWNQSLERMTNEGFVESSSNRIRLTEMGRQFADSVAMALL